MELPAQSASGREALAASKEQVLQHSQACKDLLDALLRECADVLSKVGFRHRANLRSEHHASQDQVAPRPLREDPYRAQNCA